MKRVFGTSVPPKVSSDTGGQVLVRVEKLVLDRDSMTAEAAGWNLDGCVVEPLWWGEDSAHRPNHSLSRVTPSTPDVVRSAVTIVFPVKTTRPLLEAYFRQMTENNTGLGFNVVATAAATGRRRDTVVGSASICLDALTPKKHLGGWFTVLAPQGGIVGKLKLHITVSYFAVSGKRAAAAVKEEEKAAPQREPAAAAATAACSSRSIRDGTEDAQPDVTTATSTIAADTSRPHQRTVVMDSSVGSASAQPPVEGNRAPAPPPRVTGSAWKDAPEMAAPLHSPGQQAVGDHDPRLGEHLQSVLQRGLELRSALHHTATTDNLHRVASEPYNAAASSARLASVFTSMRAPRGAGGALPLFLQPMKFVKSDFDDDLGTAASDDEDGRLSPAGGGGRSAMMMSQEEVTLSSDSDADSPVTGRHHSRLVHHAPRHPTQPQAQRPREETSVAAAPANVISDPCVFAVEVTELSLAPRGFGGVQLALRMSRDVFFPQPPPDPMWSPVFPLPLSARAGAFRIPVSGYTANSKLVLECYGVSGAEHRGLTMIGICMCPLQPAAHPAASFRSPATSDVEARAQIRVVRDTTPSSPPPVRATEPPMALQGPYSIEPPALSASPLHADRPAPAATFVPGGSAACAPAPRPTVSTPSPTVATAVVHPRVAHGALATQSPHKHQYSDSSARGVLRVSASRVSELPQYTVPEEVSASTPRLVVALDGCFTASGQAIEWNSDVDAYVCDVGCRPSLVFNTAVSIVDEALALSDVASIGLRLFFASESSSDSIPTGPTVTSEELLAQSTEFGTVKVDVRSMLKYGQPTIDCWCHVLGSARASDGGNDGVQLRVRVEQVC